MTDSLASWDRPYYRPGGGEAFLFYAAFGAVAQCEPLSQERYRCAKVPKGCDLAVYDREQHGEVLTGFTEGYLWERLKAKDSELAARVELSPRCVVLRGSPGDMPTLDYLRDAVGLVTYFLDQGACAVFDPQMFRWWSPEAWREEILEPTGPVPRHHVTILVSDEEGGETSWLHTRGMRKFGRPDLSVRSVGAEYYDAVVDLCNRFIEFQAFGGVIGPGQTIRMASLPPGGFAEHAGDLEDPDFNNVHVEIMWPDRSLQAAGEP